jgi:hypothetical protein
MGLTIEEIENTRPRASSYKIADGRGLCLLVSPSGANLWRWRYRFGGEENMMALGEYPDVTLEEARGRRVPQPGHQERGINIKSCDYAPFTNVQ